MVSVSVLVLALPALASRMVQPAPPRGVAALGAVCVANYYADQSEKREADEDAREAERRDAIRKQREERRRALDAPARLAFTRRQLAHSQQAGAAARVAELRREIAALEP